MVRASLAAALIFFGAVPARAEDGGLSGRTNFATREFGDWSVACDNARNCTAVSVSRAYVTRINSTDPGDYASPKLWVWRAAGPSARPRVLVDTSVWGEVRPPGPLSLHIYYDCDGDCTGRAYRMTGIESGRYELESQHIELFLAESLKSSRAATRLRNGAMHGILTTNGLMAAMLYMDEAQGRTGTKTAMSFHARGQKPAGAVPSPLPRPAVTIMRGEEEPVAAAHDHTALHRKRAEHCQIFGRPSSDSAPQRIKLANGQRLWSVACNSTPHLEKRLWLIETDTDRFEIFRLPRPDQKLPSELPILPNSDFDVATGRITSFGGITCGWRRSWAWTGTAFEMMDAVEMPACIDILPQHWLQTYLAVPE